MYKKSSLRQGRVVGSWVSRNWFNVIILYVAGHFALQNDLNLRVELNPSKAEKELPSVQTLGISLPIAERKLTPAVPAANVSQFKKIREARTQDTKQKGTIAVPGFSMRNLTPLLSPGYAKRKGIPQEIVDARIQVCKNYVAAYSKIAIEEMRAYGIPASITLAQGLLESDAGESVLARESLNHFGIKCRTKCLGCTCRNYADDVAYDMFRVFEGVEESFREHSILLSSPRYKHLKKLDSSDYKGWAKGLKKAGYATDQKYAEKLVKIIEALDLDQYDQRA